MEDINSEIKSFRNSDTPLYGCFGTTISFLQVPIPFPDTLDILTGYVSEEVCLWHNTVLLSYFILFLGIRVRWEKKEEFFTTQFNTLRS